MQTKEHGDNTEGRVLLHKGRKEELGGESVRAGDERDVKSHVCVPEPPKAVRQWGAGAARG